MAKSYEVGRKYYIGEKAFYLVDDPGNLGLPDNHVVTCTAIINEDCISTDATYGDNLDTDEYWWVGTIDDLENGYVTLVE